MNSYGTVLSRKMRAKRGVMAQRGQPTFNFDAKTRCPEFLVVRDALILFICLSVDADFRDYGVV